MNVITIEEQAYQKLIHRINSLLGKLEKGLPLESGKFTWIDNSTFCQQLGITKRTAQSYRDKKLISFSQIGSKIYYKSTDVEAFLQKHHIKSRD